MTTNLDNLRDHQISKEIEEFNRTLADLASDKRIVGNEEIVQKLQAISDYVWTRINSTDPTLLADSQLEAIRSQFQEANQRLITYNKLPSTQYLNDAITYAEQALAQSSNIPAQLPVGGEQIRDLVVSIRRTAGQHIHNLEEEVKALKAELKSARDSADALIKDLDKQKGRLDKAISDFQSQFSTSEESRRTTFSEDLHRWGHEFSTALEKARESAELAGGELDLKISEIVLESRDEVASHLKDLRKYRTDAQRLVGVIGNTGTALGFQETAVSEGRSAKLWEWLTIGSLAALVVTGVVIFVMTTREGFDWHVLAARAVLAIPLGVLAGYAGHKAEQHRIVERNSRRMALELASISPYLATMPDDTQHEVKRLLAERFFAQPQTLQTKSEKSSSSGMPTDVLKSALDNLKVALEIITKK